MSNPAVNPTRQQLDELDALLQRMLSLPVNPSEGQSHASPPPQYAPPPPQYAPPPPPQYAPPPMNYSFSAPTPPPMPAAPPPAPMPPRTMAPMPPVPMPPPPPRPIEVGPGDQSWSVPLPSPGQVAVHGPWAGGVDPLSVSMRTAVPPPPAPGSLRVSTVPSPDEQNRMRDTPPPMQRLRIESPSNQTLVNSAAAAPNPAVREPWLAFHLWPAAAIDWMCGSALGMFGAPGRWFGRGSGKLLIGWCGILMLCGAIGWGVVDYFGWSW